MKKRRQKWQASYDRTGRRLPTLEMARSWPAASSLYRLIEWGAKHGFGRAMVDSVLFPLLWASDDRNAHWLGFRVPRHRAIGCQASRRERVRTLPALLKADSGITRLQRGILHAELGFRRFEQHHHDAAVSEFELASRCGLPRDLQILYLRPWAEMECGRAEFSGALKMMQRAVAAADASLKIPNLAPGRRAFNAWMRVALRLECAEMATLNGYEKLARAMVDEALQISGRKKLHGKQLWTFGELAFTLRDRKLMMKAFDMLPQALEQDRDSGYNLALDYALRALLGQLLKKRSASQIRSDRRRARLYAKRCGRADVLSVIEATFTALQLRI